MSVACPLYPPIADMMAERLNFGFGPIPVVEADRETGSFTIACIRVWRYLLGEFEQLMIARMAPYGVEIGIVLEP